MEDVAREVAEEEKCGGRGAGAGKWKVVRRRGGGPVIESAVRGVRRVGGVVDGDHRLVHRLGCTAPQHPRQSRQRHVDKADHRLS